MYFALIPTPESISELTDLVRDPVQDPHVTILFSPDRKTVIPDNEVRAVFKPHIPMIIQVMGLNNLGPMNKTVWALLLDKPYWLTIVRHNCETLLALHGIPWDSTWSFNPHLTISKRTPITLDHDLPKILTFDRIELRM